jgi:hypothetical protein
MPGVTLRPGVLQEALPTGEGLSTGRAFPLEALSTGRAFPLEALSTGQAFPREALSTGEALLRGRRCPLVRHPRGTGTGAVQGRGIPTGRAFRRERHSHGVSAPAGGTPGGVRCAGLGVAVDGCWAGWSYGVESQADGESIQGLATGRERNLVGVGSGVGCSWEG